MLSQSLQLTAEEAYGPYASIMYCMQPWNIASKPSPKGMPLVQREAMISK